MMNLMLFFAIIGELLRLINQPTMSRFENSITRSYLYRLAKVFVDNFIASYDNEPNIIVLDFDDTEDQVHGDQQLAFFNKYFDPPSRVVLYRCMSMKD
jgi:hypothetical protein